MIDEERYVKEGGEWKVVFRRTKPELLGPQEVPPEHPLVLNLISRGVTPIAAWELSRDFPAVDVALKLEVFDWLLEKKDKRISRNPAGYLAKSIRDDFAIPDGFRTKAQAEADRLEAERIEQDARATKADARATDARVKAEDAVIDARLASLTPEQRSSVEQEAFAASVLNAKLFGKVIVREHLRKLLGFVAEE